MTEQICLKCKKQVPYHSWSGPNDEHGGSFDNGLHLSFDGGYGEFIDAWEGPVKKVLCHECGHDLADWLGLDVHNWHTHVLPSLGGTQHADHHDGARTA